MQSFVCFVEFLLSLLWLVKKCNKCFNGPNCPPTAGWQLAKNSISNQPFHSITPVALSLCVCCSPGAFEWHEQRVASFTCRLNATKCSVRHHYEHNYNYVHYAVLISTDESAKIFLMNTANTTRCECVLVSVMWPWPSGMHSSCLWFPLQSIIMAAAATAAANRKQENQ